MITIGRLAVEVLIMPATQKAGKVPALKFHCRGVQVDPKAKYWFTSVHVSSSPGGRVTSTRGTSTEAIAPPEGATEWTFQRRAVGPDEGETLYGEGHVYFFIVKGHLLSTDCASNIVRVDMKVGDAE